MLNPKIQADAETATMLSATLARIERADEKKVQQLARSGTGYYDACNEKDKAVNNLIEILRPKVTTAQQMLRDALIAE